MVESLEYHKLNTVTVHHGNTMNSRLQTPKRNAKQAGPKRPVAPSHVGVGGREQVPTGVTVDSQIVCPTVQAGLAARRRAGTCGIAGSGRKRGKFEDDTNRL